MKLLSAFCLFVLFLVIAVATEVEDTEESEDLETEIFGFGRSKNKGDKCAHNHDCQRGWYCHRSYCRPWAHWWDRIIGRRYGESQQNVNERREGERGRYF
eukprot:TRINITY_DN10917_c0_g1_i1.p1 TRINITY_DN10917_c0_g1~~TRINITY_DN10917_c0_g1_i1.p1  ORF type:complete len:100 (-),score=9.53 TRINITY_DN10917_c0_g1_i1:152-451(-)